MALVTLKEERTKTKRAVTSAARRLHSAIEMEMDSAGEIATKLDAAYCDFADVAADYREHCVEKNVPDTESTVNNLKIDDYEKTVKDTYKEAMAAYRAYATGAASGVAHNGSSANSGSGAGANRSFNLKKREVPRFSGARKDWPEFKALWLNMVEPGIPDRIALASELKLSCRGGVALSEIDTIPATTPEAYNKMWSALCDHYDNVTLSVASALDEIRHFRSVEEEDYQGTIRLIRQIESIYQQLEVLSQVDLVSNREINLMVSYFPPLIRKDWAESYSSIESSAQLRPFVPLHVFLQGKLRTAKHMLDSQVFVKQHKAQMSRPRTTQQQVTKSTCNTTTLRTNTNKNCCMHDTNSHNTDNCRQFAGLTVQGRRDALQRAGLCFRCFGDHRRSLCQESTPCGRCGRSTHHALMCRDSESGSSKSGSGSNASEARSSIGNRSRANVNDTEVSNVATVNSNAAQGSQGLTVYAIYEAPVTSARHKAAIFCDDGSDTTFISSEGVSKLNAKKVGPTTIEITTLNGTEKKDTFLHEVSIITTAGRKVPITAIELPRLTGEVSQLDSALLSRIFTGYDVSVLQRPSRPVDILLGGDYFGLHPKHELASDGQNLSIMQGELGPCVQGSHPLLKESTRKDSQVGYSVRVIKALSLHATLRISHPEFQPTIPKFEGKQPREFIVEPDIMKDEQGKQALNDVCHEGIQKEGQVIYEPRSDTLETEEALSHKMPPQEYAGKCTQSHLAKVTADVEQFLVGEELGTEVKPKCGGCKCGKCPLVGHTYSFKEEQELDMITSNLRYDEKNQQWITSYPWIVDPQLLPNNYVAALATLRNIEKRLAKEPEWQGKYAEQIKDMEDRGVARKLSADEIKDWKGPVFYLSHLAVEQPKSQTTPVRIVFNSSQVYKGVSLNAFLAKGPDSFKSNLLGMLLRFRENQVVLYGDIKKMYNSVFLEELELHTHRFLWRDLDPSRPPDVWCITRVNMGDKPAGAIAIEAKDMTADLFRECHPKAAKFIKESAYVDDLIDSVESLECARDLAQGTDSILGKGGFKVKGWSFGGKGVPDASAEAQKVLGVSWVASNDILVVEARLNFSPKRRDIRTEPDLTKDQVPESLPQQFTRRTVLQQVMSVFDPYGFLAPFLLNAKVFLRDTWTLQLKWDDPLPLSLDKKWRVFFTELMQVNSLHYDRCVTPVDAAGDPQLILLSDGSEQAYGCSAYIRWELKDGKYWCRLLLAKCRISPINRISVPQMELNGAVLSKRCRKVIESECRFKFAKVYHLVDSETVLGMIHKVSTRFRVYEGVRIGEIQAATNGDVSSWGWVQGEDNIADWVTRPKSPSEIGPNSEWFKGPSFLYRPEEEWGVKFKPKDAAMLPGEKSVTVHATETGSPKTTDLSALSSTRCSKYSTVQWAYARILGILKARSFKGGKRVSVTTDLLKAAERFLLKDAQGKWIEKTIKEDFKTLKPEMVDGCWVVGTRISHNSPLTPENVPQVLLPSSHPLTRLLMKEAHHSGGHRGRDATVARFRTKFWTSRASKLSDAICKACQMCRLVRKKHIDQVMGPMPPDRLVPAPPFSSVALDLFGPYAVRGEVQKRTTGKAWGVIFTDLCCRALHIEVAFGYDTESFLLAFSRFTAIRGWPSTVYSDPGSQLVGANEELKRAWKSMDQDKITQVSAASATEWKFSPADSPWYQGAVESLIKSVKRAIDLSVRGHRMTVSEILTVFTQAANLVNERPLGCMPAADSDISILTPNSLLLGRSSAKNPGMYTSTPSLRTRVSLIEKVTSQFWRHWTSLYAPALVGQSKWLKEGRDLKVNDVVLVADLNVLKGEYRLARVSKVLPSADGRVRRVKIMYKRHRPGERIHEYRGASDTEIERSVQRLVLIVPIEDQ